MKKSLHFVYEPFGSLGEVSNDLLPFLKNEFDVTVECEEEPKEKDILLCHFLNSKVVESPNFKEFKKKVLIQPIDGTVILPKYVELLNQYDLIFTPGTAGKKIMEDNGVTTSIRVIRNFFKEDLFYKPTNCSLKIIPHNKIVFYHESTFHPRKGIDLLLEGYVKAFSDTQMTNDVVLLLKDNQLNDKTHKSIEDLKRRIMNLQKTYKNPAKIIKLSQDVPWDVMKKLWYNIDIYVSLARIEGFGIPLLRMAALQKPIVALDSELSGSRDWLSFKNSYLIPTKQVLAQEEFMQIYDLEKTHWATPIDINDVVKTLRVCLSDYLNKDNLKLVSEKTIKSMTLDNIAKTYLKYLKRI